MSKVYIYGLYDPFTGELRYIGKTNNLNRRLWFHVRNAEKGQRTYKASWIRSLLKYGERPIIDVIKETTEGNWQKDEQDCIAQSVEEGTRLTNLTKGGDGLIDYHHSEETKKKISEYNKKNGKLPPSWKGRKQSPEHIRKRVEARKEKGNYGHSEETKEKISKGRKGKALGNQNSLGYKHTEEWKREASESRSGKNNSFYGRSHSEETKRKISETKRKKQCLHERLNDYEDACLDCGAIYFKGKGWQ